MLEAYHLILCRASITEAFYFSRAQGDRNHQVLFEKLIGFVHTGSSGTSKATRGVELISLPLTEKEENLFEDILTRGEGDLPGAEDTLRMRKLAIGHPIDSQSVRGNGSETINGVNWEILRATAH